MYAEGDDEGSVAKGLASTDVRSRVVEKPWLNNGAGNAVSG